MLRTKRLSDLSEVSYQAQWDGRRLRFAKGKPWVVALDTETEVRRDGGLTVPRLALASVSSGEEHAIVAPGQVGLFLEEHWDCQFVMHNAAFDYWVIHEHLAGTPRSRAVLKDALDGGRLHDSMVLATLVALAEAGGGENDAALFKNLNLDLLAQQYAGLKVPKDDPYRLRYGEIIGKDLAAVDPGFLDYAIQDAIVTHRAFESLMRKVTKHAALHQPPRTATRFDVYPDAPRRFGLLSETVQVKAAVVLEKVFRLGVGIDPALVGTVEVKLKETIDRNVAWIKEHYPDLFSYYKVKAKAGQFMVNPKTGVPKFQTGRLRTILGEIAAQRGIKPPRTGKTREVAASVEVWRELAPDHPLVKAWSELFDTSKLLSLMVPLRGQSTIHPRYRALVRTGRTSCYAVRGKKGDPSVPGLNIQQTPRESWFRGLFVPRPGYKLAAIDYSFIELRTLASVCLARYGRSVLADTIVKGVDPHAYTASMVGGLSLDAFMGLKKSSPADFKSRRQAAKAVNFGVPGGLGAEKLAAYAKANYGVALTKDEAGAFKKKLITEVYPELDLYLTDNSLADLASNLKVPVARCRTELDTRGDNEVAVSAVRKIVSGRPYKMDGTPYYAPWVAAVWRGLARLDNTDDLRVAEGIARREGSQWLEDRLFRRSVACLTGRVRGGVGYTEARNTPFQGLAADGAKLALWELDRQGFRIVAFVHDEIVVEVADEAEAARAGDVMNRAMEQVLFPGVPSAVEWAIGDRWIKA